MRIFRPTPATGAGRLFLLPLVLSAACLCSADTVYSVNLTIGTASVTGFIETDGTTGPYYQGAAMVDWNLLLSSGGSTFNLVGPLSGSNSIADVSDLYGHGMLSATSTQLLYDFNTGYGGFFIDQNPPVGYYGGSFLEFSDEGAPTISDPNGEALVINNDASTVQSVALNGEQVIGTATTILNNFQGGTSSTPVVLPPVAGVTGALAGGVGVQSYYSFSWAGGAFSATESISGASLGASYLFSEGAIGTCSGGGSATLNNSDSFTGTIAIANLAAGQYCIGIDANGSSDPAFALTFNTPIGGSVPEPSSFVLMSLGCGMAGVLRLMKRTR